MGTPANLGSGGLAARPTWVTRNWKWAIPLGVLVLFVLLVAFVGGIFLLVETSFQHSEFYTQALARARADPEVAAKIGQAARFRLAGFRERACGEFLRER